MAKINRLPRLYVPLRRSLERYVAHRHALAEYTSEDLAMANCYARETGFDDQLFATPGYSVALLTTLAVDLERALNRAIHASVKSFSEDLSRTRRYGRKALAVHPSLGADAAGYRAFLTALFDLAVLDAMTFEKRPEGGQVLLNLRQRLRREFAFRYGLSRYATDRAVNHAWPGIFQEHGLMMCRREGNTPRCDSKGTPYGGVKMRALLVARDGESCAACFRPMDRFALHVDHVVPLSGGGDSEIANLLLLCPDCDGMKRALGLVALLAMLERRRREARTGGLID